MGTKQKMIRAIIKKPQEKYGHAEEIPNTLEALQKEVGGFIETVPLCSTADGKEAIFICNEEGLLMNLPMQNNLPFAGTVLVVGVDGEEFCDCPFSMRFWERMIRGEV